MSDFTVWILFLLGNRPVIRANICVGFYSVDFGFIWVLTSNYSIHFVLAILMSVDWVHLVIEVD